MLPAYRYPIALLTFLVSVPLVEQPARAQQPAEQITEDLLRAHIQFLADDLLEGRGPGSRGDEVTQLYLETQYKIHGLIPGAANDQWRQPVPLVGVTTSAPKR